MHQHKQLQTHFSIVSKVKKEATILKMFQLFHVCFPLLPRPLQCSSPLFLLSQLSSVSPNNSTTMWTAKSGPWHMARAETPEIKMPNKAWKAICCWENVVLNFRLWTAWRYYGDGRAIKCKKTRKYNKATRRPTNRSRLTEMTQNSTQQRHTTHMSLS